MPTKSTKSSKKTTKKKIVKVGCSVAGKLMHSPNDSTRSNSGKKLRTC